MVRWFGYKLHLVVDAKHELPVAYTVTKGSRSDVKEGHVLLDEMEKRHPEMLKKAEVLTADRGYDDSKLLSRCWDEYGIKPVIDTRRLWKDGEQTRLLPGHTNVVYDEGGAVYCYCPETGARQQMSNGGFEKDRGTLKKVCPAKAYGITCQGREQCPVAGGGAGAARSGPADLHADCPGELQMGEGIPVQDGGGEGEQSLGRLVWV
ncbi:transposase [Kyrpidia spormannii]|uniref:Transposase IS4-like domain-containing protein n=2 Tax=Kyrpidia spormannii TaxID=2055160 RepID=A0A6F9E3M2_9BACL|nr:transposase [Kyrpidia spormannii]CAB3390540.1 protein of unknown function [Kyrpidia spormannii]CAB3391457.1 protein of unknown function [Kyrpidia spormannii]